MRPFLCQQAPPTYYLCVQLTCMGSCMYKCYEQYVHLLCQGAFVLFIKVRVHNTLGVKCVCVYCVSGWRNSFQGEIVHSGWIRWRKGWRVRRTRRRRNQGGGGKGGWGDSVGRGCCSLLWKNALFLSFTLSLRPFFRWAQYICLKGFHAFTHPAEKHINTHTHSVLQCTSPHHVTHSQQRESSVQWLKKKLQKTFSHFFFFNCSLKQLFNIHPRGQLPSDDFHFTEDADRGFFRKKKSVLFFFSLFLRVPQLALLSRGVRIQYVCSAFCFMPESQIQRRATVKQLQNITGEPCDPK